MTARAAARRMIEQRSGVILMHTPEPARLGAALTGGMTHRRRLGLDANAHGITREQFTGLMSSMSHRKTPTTLAEFADVAAFVASNQSAMTGTVANLTGGVIVD